MDLTDFTIASRLVGEMSTSTADLTRIAQYHASLRSLVATHPQADLALLNWLDALGDPGLSAIVADRKAELRAAEPVSMPPQEASELLSTLGPVTTPTADPKKKSMIGLVVLVVVLVLALVAAGFFVFSDWFSQGETPSTPSPSPTASTIPTPYPTENPEPGWIRSLCGSDWDIFKDVAVAGNGSIVAIGLSYSSDYDFSSLSDTGDRNGIAVVYDSQGEFVSMGFADSDRYHAVASGADGTIVIVGESLNDAGDHVPSITKYDQYASSILWTRVEFEGWEGELQYLDAVAVDERGFITVLGFNNSYHRFIAQVDPDGNPQWFKQIDTKGPADRILTTKWNDIVLVGSIDWDPEPGQYSSAALVTMFNPDGDELWEKTYAEYGFEAFTGITASRNGFIVYGYHVTRDSQTPPHFWKPYLVEIDASGEVLWTKQYDWDGGAGSMLFNDVTVTSDGRIIAVGWAEADEGEFRTWNEDLNFPIDAIVAQFSSAGELEKTTVYGGHSDDQFYGVVSISSGVIAVGSTLSGDGNLPPTCGSADPVIISIEL